MDKDIGNLLLPVIERDGKISNIQLSSLRDSIKRDTGGDLYFQTNICEGVDECRGNVLDLDPGTEATTTARIEINNIDIGVCYLYSGGFYPHGEHNSGIVVGLDLIIENNTSSVITIDTIVSEGEIILQGYSIFAGQTVNVPITNKRGGASVMRVALYNAPGGPFIDIRTEQVG